MKCLVALCLVMFGCCLAEQLNPLPNSYGYIPRNSNQDSLLSYVAINNPVVLRQDPVYLQEQVPQLEVVSHRGSFSHYVHPRNFQTFQASLQSSAVPSNVVTLTRSGSIVQQPLLAVQRTESRIDIPSGIQGPQGIQQNSQVTSQLSQQLGQQLGQPLGPQGRLTGLGGPSAQRQSLNYDGQRGPQGTQSQRGQGPNSGEQLQRRQ